MKDLAPMPLSSAVDGIRVAEAIIRKYANP